MKSGPIVAGGALNTLFPTFSEVFMHASLKWLVPTIALGLMVSLAGTTRAEDKAKAENATITGTVTGEDGKPAADIEVRVMPPRPKHADGERPPRHEPKPQAAEDGEKPGDVPPPRPPRPEPIAKTTTDADGKYSIEVPAGDYLIAAGKRDVGAARREVTVSAGESKSVDLQLKKMPRGERRPGDPGAPAPEKGEKAPE
jgi:hypothetical protein